LTIAFRQQAGVTPLMAGFCFALRGPVDM